MSKTWSDDDLNFLRDNYGKLSYAEIGDVIGKSPMAVKSKGAVILKRVSRNWPAEHLEILKRDYATKAAPAIAAEIGRGVSAVHGMAHKLGLKKVDDWYQREESGRRNLLNGKQHRFQKGMTPWSKGKKLGPAHPNSKKTQFKKGSRPQNAVPVGTIVTHGSGYLKIKIGEPNVWEFYHHHVWVKHRGPVPKGHVIRFRDGNSTNCEIDNLVLMTRTEHALRNSIWKYPEELVPTMAVLADLKKEIRNAEEKQNGRSA